jgi:hypothetical protein
MLHDKREMMNMISDFLANEDIVASLNKTNESRVKRLEKENKIAIAERDTALTERDIAFSERDAAISKMKSAVAEISEKDALIAELKRQLAGNQER